MLYKTFFKKSPILGVLQGFEPISEKNMEKIMEKTCDFLPRVIRWKSESISSHPRSSIKKVFLIILQNTQKNTCAGVSFLIKLLAEASNFINIETLTKVFSCELCEIFKNTFFTEHLWFRNAF